MNNTEDAPPGSLQRMVRPPDCYVGRLPCGCLVAWVYDNGKHPKEVAESVAEFIRNGYAVERANTDDVRSQLGPCKHKRPNDPSSATRPTKGSP